MGRFKSVISCLGAVVLLCSAAHAGPSKPRTNELQRLRASDAIKLHPMLRVLGDNNLRSAKTREGLVRRFPQFGRGDVAINVVASGDAVALANQLKSLGLSQSKVFGSMVSGRMPISGLKSLAAVPGVQSVRPAMARTNHKKGLVVSQGDRSLRSDRARRIFDVDGRGVKVGILSDSFSCLTGPLFEGQLFTTTEEGFRW